MLNELLSVFFPHLCAGCQQPLIKGENHICTDCVVNLPFTDHYRHEDNAVEKLFWGRARVNAAMSLLYFNKGNRVQRLLHQLKYKNNQEVGLMLGHLLGSKIKLSRRFIGVDVVIPVPLHPKKLKKRGYNQSEFIAKGIAEELGIPISTTMLTRSINNPTQTNKSRFERFENVTDVFTVMGTEEVKSKHVLLVDDVITTGSTLESCINILTKSGQFQVSVCVAACAE
jgi:ComF family protein